MIDHQPWASWCLKGVTRLLMFITSVLYNHAIVSLSWLSSKAQKEWNATLMEGGGKCWSIVGSKCMESDNWGPFHRL